MKKSLTRQEILAIERQIDLIDRTLDVLDPCNAIEAQEIERKAYLLRSYIFLLESVRSKPSLRALDC